MPRGTRATTQVIVNDRAVEAYVAQIPPELSQTLIPDTSRFVIILLCKTKSITITKFKVAATSLSNRLNETHFPGRCWTVQ